MQVKALGALAHRSGRRASIRTCLHHNTNLHWRRRGEGRATIHTPVRLNQQQIVDQGMFDGEDAQPKLYHRPFEVGVTINRDS